MFCSLFRLPPTTQAQRSLALATALLVLLGSAAARTRRTNAVYTMTATAYEAVAGQTDSKPFITADNSRIPRGYGSHTRWLALSRDLLRPWGGPFEYGDKVRVRGVSHRFDGVYTVHDTMNRRYRHRLDVLVHPRERISLHQPGVQLERLTSPAANTAVSRPARPSKVSISKKLRAPRTAAPAPVTRGKSLAKVSKKARATRKAASAARHKSAAKPTKKARATRQALPPTKHRPKRKSSAKKARSER